MSEVILVVLQRPERAAGLLGAAQCLATLLGGARVSAVAARTPPGLLALAAEASLPDEMLAAIAAEEQSRVASLKAAFETWTVRAGQAGSTARWSDGEGLLHLVIEERGRRADFITIARPEATDDGATRQAFRAALFGTERPVLVVPPNPAAAEFGRRVAIAWRDDGRAAKAVLPALRCLARAERVFLLAGVREGRTRPAMPEVLSEHDIEAELHVLPIGPGVFGQILLDKAHALGADLLVMGAYAHSPLRELVLGGVTRFMLGHADLPVLMRH